MAKKFKDYYNAETAQLIGNKIAELDSKFETDLFVSLIRKGIAGKEFLARQDVFVRAFEECLGKDYQSNIAVFTKILGPELETDTGMFTHGYWLWPIGRYVERNGDAHYKCSIDFIYELTKRFTGEFAIRPILAKHPKRTIATMTKWSTDKCVHVRRLASEGIRINLPWAKRSFVCLDYFDDYQKILSNLRHDQSKFVQKSVGNNLNDLYKHDPEKAMSIIKAWREDNPGKATLWIIKHGLRSTRRTNTATS